jgi:C_GCAxxG_C_C family probable redox protein
MGMGEKALEHFSNGYVCSEAVLKSAMEFQGIDDATVGMIASAFGSGMARVEGGLCGAFSGALMALSLVQGRKSSTESLDPIYTNVAQFKKRFEQAFGSCECARLLGFSLSDADAGVKFKEGHCKAQKCDTYVRFAADEVEKML